MTSQAREAAGERLPLAPDWSAASGSRWAAIVDRLQPWPASIQYAADLRGTDRYLPNARVFLAVAALLTLYLIPSEPHSFPAATFQLLWFYLAFGIVVLLVRKLAWAPRGGTLLVHAVDVVIPCALILFNEGPGSPFFVMLPFALLAAGYRWGLGATLVTGAVGILTLVVSAIIVGMQIGPAVLHTTPLDPTQFLLRAVYLAIMTVLVGYLAEGSHRAHGEAEFIADLFNRVRSRTGVRELVGDLAERLTQLYGARGALLAVQDETIDRGMLWSWDNAAPADQRLQSTPLTAEDRALYLAARDVASWQELRNAGNAIFARHRCHALIGASLPLGDGMEACIYVLDPAGAPVAAYREHFLATVGAHVAPAVYNNYLLHRRRSRVAAGERSRLAREMHDGVVQSLLGLELQIDAIRRQDEAPAAIRDDLEQVRDQLRAAVVEARSVMLDLKRQAVTPRNLADSLRSLAMRLQRETGIEVEVRGLGTAFDCTRHGARLLALIVQEALANVRKHSGARHVTILHTREGDASRLVIADDGRGFPFAGRLSGSELEHSASAPAALIERVRSLGGRLTIESTPGAGSWVIVEWTGRRHG